MAFHTLSGSLNEVAVQDLFAEPWEDEHPISDTKAAISAVAAIILAIDRKPSIIEIE
jgi:hypothetical protein